MLILTSNDFDPNASPEPAEFEQIAGLPGDDNRRPVAAAGDLSFSVATGLAGGKKTIHIQSKISLFNADPSHVPPGVFEAFRRYIRYAIEATWNSATNDLISLSRNVTCNITVTKRLTNTGTLAPGELFIAVKKDEGRSFIRGVGGRSGIFFINDDLFQKLKATHKTLIDVKNPSEAKIKKQLLSYDNYTAAHEFGHVLGLADRYAYICYYLPTPPPPKILPSNYKAPPPVIIGDRAHAPTLYLTEAYDSEYATDYRWLFNLMSTRREPVAGSATGAVHWDDDLQRSNRMRVHRTKKYIAAYPGGPKTTASHVFITEKQLSLVEASQRETLPGAALIYFKEIDRDAYLADPVASTGDYVFLGTFVGLTEDGSGGMQVMNDDRYDLDRNSGDNANDPTKNANPVDGKMDRRCYRIPAGWTEGDALQRPAGFLDAALDINVLAQTYAATKSVDGYVIPERLLELLDVEHLDRKVSIRRYVSEVIQGRLDSNGDFLLSGKKDEIRKIVFSVLDEIKKKDPGEVSNNSPSFTPKTDLFANDDDIFADGPAEKTGLFVPYDYKQFKFRKGKTLFYTSATPPAGEGIPVPVTDSNLIAATDTSHIRASIPAAAKIVSEIWNAALKPESKLFSYNAKRIMDYDAGIYSNRKNLILLQIHGRLEMASKGPSNPKNSSVHRCFYVTYFPYPGPSMRTTAKPVDNSNPKGIYIGLCYKF